MLNRLHLIRQKTYSFKTLCKLSSKNVVVNEKSDIEKKLPSNKQQQNREQLSIKVNIKDLFKKGQEKRESGTILDELVSHL